MKTSTFSLFFLLMIITYVTLPLASKPTDETNLKSSPTIAMKHTEVVKKHESAIVGITALQGEMAYFGTGTLISEDGYILTSTSVVPNNSNTIGIILKNGKKVFAKQIGTVDDLELSLLKIEGEHYHYLTLGDSANLKIGSTVYTFGNCFHSIEIDGRISLSQGTISGFYAIKELQEQASYLGPVLETTAALNPGVDGGPLVDEQGNYVGLLSLNFSTTRWLGLAIPVNVLKKELARLMGKPIPATSLPVPQEDVFAWPELQRVSKSVIAIEVERTKDIPTPPQREDPDTPQRLLTDTAKTYRTRPVGPVTGLIIDSDGWILTSYYNIAGTLKSMTVILSDGKRVKAELYGWDQSKDVALLKADVANLPAAPIAKNRLFNSGDIIYSIGKSPDPLRFTVTQGIISATSRNMGTALQHDAKVNYGNTGGPIVNRNGEVIGLTAHITNSMIWGQSSGVGFAIPWSKIEFILTDLMAKKKIKAAPLPFLGVSFDMDAHDIKGASITTVFAESAASIAGIQEFDIITEANGFSIKNPMDLARIIQRYQVGDTLRFQIVRGEKKMLINATLRARPLQIRK